MERWKPKPEHLRSWIALGLLTQATVFAFTKQVRREISIRDGGECRCCGYDKHLEASHLNHTRNEHYNNPDNGEMLCAGCHFDYHVSAIGDSVNCLGLSEVNNLSAVKSLWKRMDQFMKDERELPKELVGRL